MDFYHFRKKALKLHPEIILEEVITHSTRQKIKKFLVVFVLLFLAVYILGGETLGPYQERVLGITLLFASLWMIFLALDAFYYSHYFAGVNRLGQTGDKYSGFKAGYVSLSYELANIIAHTGKKDLTLSFLKTEFGKEVSLRLGILNPVKDFRSKRENSFKGEDLEVPSEINLIEYLKQLYRQDKDFSEFLFSYGVQEKEFLGAAGWVLRQIKTSRIQERWWSREALMRKGSIGSDWAYGRAYELEKYAASLEGSSGVGVAEEGFYHREELDALINILSKERESNALLVGEEGVGRMDIVTELSGRINSGEISNLRDRHLMVLYADALIADSQEKSVFESRFIKMLNQAVRAGNLILVFPDFPGFISSAEKLGSDVVSLLDPFLNSRSLQIIALSDTDRYHGSLERNPRLTKRFERIFVKSGNKEGVMKMIENEALRLESRHKVLFTYQALLSVEEGAERYFSEGSVLDKSLDLLNEVVSASEKKSKNTLISKESVSSLIESKTGISLGGVSTDAEKDKLLHLEEVLHRRVVGQDEAVKAISGAVRRGRAGIASGKKPLGSFLFLGPTGVGKTETAKALAEVFFGDESKMLRLDMSEFNSLDSLDRLIGSFEGGKSGIFSSMLRENPYGVLLLDEFEKTHRNVLDLFLQIFDEGVFSDAEGKHINARNIIFVATSNAGSSLIWDILQAGKNLREAKDEVIESIIKEGVYKPELLNRFDGVILFHPLESNHLQEVARRKLSGLKERIREKGIDLVITDSLIRYVAEKGVDPKFGARPLNRVIKEEIEELIAEKIISGQARPGTKISLSREDLEGKTE